MRERTRRLLRRSVTLALAASIVLPMSAQRSEQRDILFDSKLEGSEIWSIRPDGSGLRRLTQSPKDTSNQVPRWAPDGRQIAFGSSLGNLSSSIVIINTTLVSVSSFPVMARETDVP